VVDEDSAQSLIDALSVAIGRPVLLDDAELVPLAYSRQWDIDPVRRNSILSRGPAPAVREALLAQGIAEASGVVRTNAVPELGMAERLCVPVRAGEQALGYIWLLDPEHELTAQDLERAGAAARTLARILTRSEPAVADEGTLIEGLCSPSAPRREQAVAGARTRGLLTEERVVLCLLHAFDDADAAVVARRAARRLSTGHAVAGAAAEGASVLATISDPILRTLPGDEIARWLHTVAHADVAVGQSGVADLGAMHEAARQARLALRVARARPREAAFAAWGTMGPDRLVAQLPLGALADVPEGLRRLLSEEPVLTATLATFLDAGGDVKLTAAALSLHRSGLYYRLHRIEEITGLKLRSGGDRLLAHLALRAERLS